MAVGALLTPQILISATTSGGTAPGGASAPTGCTLGTPVDIAPWVTTLGQSPTVAELTANTFGTGGFASIVAGLKSGKVDLSLFQDWAGSAINAYLGLNGSIATPGSFFFMELRPGAGNRGSTNPGFVCRVLHSGFPWTGSIGEIPTIGLSLSTTGGYAELTN